MRVAAIPGHGIGPEAVSATLPLMAGLAPNANITPGKRPGRFEPVHGSAPDVGGRSKVLGDRAPHTPDLDGRAGTAEVGNGVLAALKAAVEPGS